MKDLPCPPDLWPRFSTRLDEALALDATARAGWLDTLPPQDAELKPWLAAVLSADAKLSTREALQRPRLAAGDEAHEPPPGQRIGPWRLTAPLGSGGMGRVWRAERADGAYRREVALKLPHAHLLSGALQARFARERDILAALEHPHIARFYDAGLGEGGQPWLALELVEGETITRHCERLKLGIEARLELVQQMAAAVQAAHARLIVHRDLKPANVLVTPEGRVKLLDFGIAKLLGGEDDAALTQATVRPATPDYAAPEQLDGGAITVATDVFALGAMLFELLTGARPFAPRSALGATVTPRGEAPLASTRAAAARQAALRGDLDALCAKALDPDPARRYASVEGFAADIARHRAHLPIAARRITRRQRVGKFIRRHRAPLGVAALLLAVLFGGVAGIVWQAREAAAQARRAEAVQRFLVSVFKASDPRIASDKPRGGITARELLDAAGPRIDAEFADDPAVRIELLRTVAEIYRALDDRPRYAAMQARMLQHARAHYGELHEISVDGALTESQLVCGTQQWPRCRQLQTAVDALITRAGMDDTALRGRWWTLEGQRLRAVAGSDAARRAAFENAVAIFSEHAPTHRSHVTALDELAGDQSLAEGGKAVALYRQAIALALGLPERNDANLQVTYGNLGITLLEQGRYAEALQAYAQALAIAARTTGLDAPRAWVPRSKHAQVLHLMGERVAAHAEYDRLLAVLPPPGEHEYRAAIARESYARRLVAEGRPQAAIPLLEALAEGYASRPVWADDLRKVQGFLGDAYDAAGRRAEAGPLLRGTLESTLAAEPQDSNAVLAARERWGRFLVAHGDPAAARAQFDAVLAQARGRTLTAIVLAHAGLAEIALREGQGTAALAASEAAQAAWQGVTGIRDVRTGVRLKRIQADVLAARGALAAAQQLEDEAAAASARYDDPASPTVRRRVMKAP